MSENLFLTINGTSLPEPSIDGYHAYEERLKEQLGMISGRLVEEERGLVWRIDYTSGQMLNSTLTQVLAALRAKGAKTVSFLPDNSPELVSGSFLVVSITQPTLAFFDGAEPVWTGLGFSLREVRPHA